MPRQRLPIGRPWKTTPQNVELQYEIVPRYCGGMPWNTTDEKAARRAALEERRAYLRCLRGYLGDDERLRAKHLGFAGVAFRWHRDGEAVVVEDYSKFTLRFCEERFYRAWAEHHRRASARDRTHRPVLVHGSGSSTSAQVSRGHLHLVVSRWEPRAHND